MQSSLISISHGMFNRYNGKSAPPYYSLNVSYGVGDDARCVAANREGLKNLLGATFLLSARQIHKDVVYCSGDLTRDMEVDGCDALMTNQPGIALMIQQADCQALLIHDPKKHIVAAVHCGWRGSAINIIGQTIAAMQRIFQTRPADLRVAISPSLGPCCAEFIDFRSELPEQLHQYQVEPNHFNFWKISRSQLMNAGVSDKFIDIAGICTVCNHDYFSYRRTRKKGGSITGRHCSAICLPLK